MFARIFDAVFDSVLITDPAGNIREANEVCRRTLGYGRDVILGMDLASILSEEDAALILELGQGETKGGLYLTLKTADGKAIPVKVNAQRIMHKGEDVILCVARDITERTGAKDGKCRAAFEEIQDGYWETDLTGTLTFVNDAMCRMAEATREELLSGVNFGNYTEPETQKEIYKIFEKVYLTGMPSELGDHEVTRRNGSVGVFQFNVSLIRDDRGRPVGFRGITREVTERRATERALRESEEGYRNILALAPDGIAVVRRKDAVYLQVNDAFCRQTGYSADEIIGRTSSDLALYADSSDRKRLFGVLAQKGRVDGIEIRFRAKDGTILDDLVSARLIHFRGEDCFLIVATVITSLKRAQESLRRSEEKYRTILEGISAGYYELDLGGRFTFFNDAMCRIMGYSRKELMGMGYREYTTPEAAQRGSAAFSEVYRTGKPGALSDHEIIRKDGKTVILEQSILLMSDEEGKGVGFRGVTHDVTERRAMEAALRESEERYRRILEEMDDGYWEIDLEGRFTFFNDAMCRIAGYTREGLMGLRASDDATPEAARKMVKVFEGIYRTGKPAEITDYEITQGSGAKGSFEMSASLMRDEEGNPIGFRGITRDVTKRKVMEQALRESEEKYRTILEGMEEGYYEVDLAGRFTFFNDALCRMVGYSREELLGMGNREYTTPETAKRVYTVFNEIYRTGKPAEIIDHEIVKKDGSRSIHELSVSLMRDKEGVPVGFRGVVRDITLRRRAEEEIKAHREHLALINQILRHDLTNDLIVIQSGLNLYKTSREREILEETAGRVKKSLGLIDKMRALESFISSHKDLRAYRIRDVITEIARGYPFIDVKIKGRAQVMADDSLSSVVDNIIRNAVIHGKADRIEATIGRREGMCEVHITDNGSGIPDEIRDTIFEEGAIYGDTGHTGLGLHIVKKAMEKYGGYVYAKGSESGGAEFVLAFKAL